VTDLFGAPLPPPVQELSIRPRGAAPLDKAQTAFNRLVKQVETLRAKLGEWTAFAQQLQPRVMRELQPVQQRLLVTRRETILLIGAILDGTAGGARPGRAERRNLEGFLTELTEVHLSEDPQDEDVLALHDRYAELSFAEDQELERRLTREMAQEMLGVELDDEALDGATSMEEVLAAGLEKARLAEQDRAETERNRKPRGRKAQEREQARAAAAEQAAQDVSQSVREVYRKLASALHPDRAADEPDRLRRNALMQRVNQAYDSRDLLGLLTLQLEIEQIDAVHLAQVSKARLGHYNAVLREQVRELEQEIAALKAPLAMIMGDPFANVTIANVERSLKSEIAQLKRAAEELKRMQALMLQPGLRKQWLRQHEQERRQQERLDAQMLDVLGSLDPFGAGFEPFADGDADIPFGAPAQRRRGSRTRRA
jgi:hypothetical protein